MLTKQNRQYGKGNSESFMDVFTTVGSAINMSTMLLL